MEKVNLRNLIQEAIVQTQKSIPTIAKESGINQHVLYNFLKGTSEMTSINLEKLLSYLPIKIKLIKKEK